MDHSRINSVLKVIILIKLSKRALMRLIISLKKNHKELLKTNSFHHNLQDSTYLQLQRRAQLVLMFNHKLRKHSQDM